MYSYEWHDLIDNPDDKPAPGERVIFCIGESFSGEGYLKLDGKLYRYDGMCPIEEFMRQPVTAWTPMLKPYKRPPATDEKLG